MITCAALVDMTYVHLEFSSIYYVLSYLFQCILRAVITMATVGDMENRRNNTSVVVVQVRTVFIASTVLRD